jgi:hypothetical protein
MPPESNSIRLGSERRSRPQTVAVQRRGEELVVAANLVALRYPARAEGAGRALHESPAGGAVSRDRIGRC